jgi:hypothetical protein
MALATDLPRQRHGSPPRALTKPASPRAYVPRHSFALQFPEYG